MVSLLQLCGRCFGRQNHLKRHVEGVHKNVIGSYANYPHSTNNSSNVLKVEEHFEYYQKKFFINYYHLKKNNNLLLGRRTSSW